MSIQQLFTPLFVCVYITWQLMLFVRYTSHMTIILPCSTSSSSFWRYPGVCMCVCFMATAAINKSNDDCTPMLDILLLILVLPSPVILWKPRQGKFYGQVLPCQRNFLLAAPIISKEPTSIHESNGKGLYPLQSFLARKSWKSIW